MIQQCIDLALGRAFVPDPQDTLMPLARRFGKRPLIAVTVYKDSLDFVPVKFSGGSPVFGEPLTRPPGGEDADADALRLFAEKHGARDCLVNLATGYTATVSSRTRRADTEEEAILLMRDNPERLLGETPAHGCRASIIYHPTHNFAVVFSHKENEINAAVTVAQKAGLGLARLHCGMSSLLGYLVGNHWAAFGKEAEVFLVDRSSLFYVSVGESAFGRPLFDVGLKEAALRQAISERAGRLKPGSRVVLVNSSAIDVAAIFREVVIDATVEEPLKEQPNPFLWACCSDRPKLAYDLYPSERTIRPFAPARLRIVPLVLWGVTGAAVVFGGINGFRQARARTLIGNLTSQQNMLEGARREAQKKIQEITDRGKLANDMCDWLLISPTTQRLLIRMNQEIQNATEEAVRENQSVAQLDSLSITREPGQPQMRVSLVVIGDGPAANRVFQRIATLFNRLGYSTVDLRVTAAPGGFRYDHLLNLPTS